MLGLRLLKGSLAHLKPNEKGKVAGFGQTKDSILILRDGKKLPDMFYDDFWEKD